VGLLEYCGVLTVLFLVDKDESCSAMRYGARLHLRSTESYRALLTGQYLIYVIFSLLTAVDRPTIASALPYSNAFKI